MDEPQTWIQMISDRSSKLTKGIRVNVRSAYINEESSPRHHYFVFAYQVEIVNESAETVQLISREWHITNGLGEARVVKGDGVIGKQPLIEPGESYKYVSGSHFQTPVGMMYGHYNMVRLPGNDDFQVDIPAFVMMVPFLNN